MLDVSSLAFQYSGGPMITFPDFSAEAKNPLLILGESGCGKTTLLHLLAGLIRPKSGEIKINDTEITALGADKMDSFRGQNIGLVFQKNHFIESLQIKDNLALSPSPIENERIDAVANRLGLSGLLRRYPHELSEGQKQRASIARSIMTSPKLILADEPTSALDHKNCLEVLQLLKEEAEITGAALIIVTHDDRLTSQVANQITLPSLQETISTR